MSKFLTIFTVAAIACTLIALPFMWLWNALLPGLFGFKEIDYVQALGLQVLSSLLFKSYNSSGK